MITAFGDLSASRGATRDDPLARRGRWPQDAPLIHDTLKLARGLEPAFTKDQAETLTTALAQSTNETVATKADLVIIRSDLVDLGNRLIKWVVGAIAFNLFGTAGLVLGLIKVVGH